MSCVAPGCKSFYNKHENYPGVCRHRFPSDPVFRQKWIDAIPRVNWNPAKFARICSLHFDEDDYELERKDSNKRRVQSKSLFRLKKLLKPDAVPHIFKGVPPMVYNERDARRQTLKCQDQTCQEDDNHTQTCPKLSALSQYKQIRKGRLDLKSITPWKLDFDTMDEDTCFWKWEEKWREFNKFSGLAKHEPEYSATTIRSFMSEKTLKLLDSFSLPASQAKDMECILTALRIYAAKKNSAIRKRIQFNLRQQVEDEPFEIFLTDLMKLGKASEYCLGCRDNLIRDKIILGVRGCVAEEKLLQMSELTLGDAIKICRADERVRATIEYQQRMEENKTNRENKALWFEAVLNEFDDEPPRKRKRKRPTVEIKTEPFEETDFTIPEMDQSEMDQSEMDQSEMDHQDDNNGSVVTYTDPNSGAFFEIIDSKVLVSVQENKIKEKVVPAFKKLASSSTMSAQDTSTNLGMIDDENSMENQIDETAANTGLTFIGDSLGDIVKEIVQGSSQGAGPSSMLQGSGEDDEVEAEDPLEINLNTGTIDIKIEPLEHAENETVVIEPEKKKKRIRIRNKSPETFVLCHLCPKSFTRHRHLSSHISHTHMNPSTKRAMKPEVRCQFCQQEFTLIRHLKLHIFKQHRDYKPFECTLCPSKFIQAAHLRRHMRVLHNDNPEYSCDQCDKKFGEKFRLLSHIKNDHEVQKCKSCQLEFPTFSKLKLHIVKNHPELRPYQCKTCEKRFTKALLLEAHEINMHQLSRSERPHKCDACGATFIYLHFLKTHIRRRIQRGCEKHQELSTRDASSGVDTEEIGIEKSVEPFQPKCKLCHQHFTTLASLKSHKASVHTIAEPVVCKICSKKFKSEKILKTHTESVHMGLKPFACPHCPSTFGQRAHQARHIAVIHEHVKYPCHVCDKMYAGKCDLSNHMKKAHNIIITSDCPHCGEKFEKKRDLLAHLDEVHGPEILS